MGSGKVFFKLAPKKILLPQKFVEVLKVIQWIFLILRACNMAIKRDPKAFGTHLTTMIEKDRLAQGLNLPPF